MRFKIRYIRTCAVWGLTFLLNFSQASAAISSSQQVVRGRGLYGDWEAKLTFGERQMDVLLSFGRDPEGVQIAQWIDLWGMSELRHLHFEDDQLSFVQVMQFGDNETKSRFTGRVEADRLTGTLSRGRGEFQLKGKRVRRIPQAVGTWQMTFRIGEHDIAATLIVREAQFGHLEAEWQSQWGEHEIIDVQYERGRLTFQRQSKFQDQLVESSFAGSIDRQTGILSGTIATEWGQIPAQGKRVHADLIGTWHLDVQGEPRSFQQRLDVFPDLSAHYGAIPIEKTQVHDNELSFTLTMPFFSNPTLEVSFQGRLVGAELIGELITSLSTRKVTGRKALPSLGRGGTRQGR